MGGELEASVIGRTLDHYRIESKLAEGGMGVVYKARDTQLDRPVAIKVLPADKVADPNRKQQFVQEARAASALNHPNIVTIYDIRSEGGVDFIVMEYLEGRTLADLIPVKGMRPARALEYALQIADALTKAHGAGIVHRDLKPANIMFTGEGRVKILDFGVAKLLERAESSANDSEVTARTLTEEAGVIGTPAYMSPEQAEGHQLDARSDIFSFGSVLYEMTTGQRPFAGDSMLSILTSILKDDPTPPRELGISISRELEKIILRCLRKDAGRRYQTMADLKVALEDVEEETGSGQQVQPVIRRRWARASLALLLLVAGVFTWRMWRTWQAPESTEPPRAVPLITLPGVQRYPSFSPDGNHVAFTWNGPKQDNPDIYVQQIGSSGSPLRLTTDPSNDYNPVWSPDDRWIAFLRSQPEAGTSELRLIPPLGGPERKLADIRVRGGTFVTPPYLAWCPNGNCLVVTDSPSEGKPDALFVISLETREKRQLTHPQPADGSDSNPAISPDGRWLVFRRQAALYSGELYRLSLGRDLTAMGEPKRLTRAALDATYPAWMPDSREVLFSVGYRQGLWRLVVPGENIPARLPFVGEDGLMPVVSRPQPGRPARLAYLRSLRDWNIWSVETSAPGAPSTAPPAVFISSTRQDWDPQFSPDGRRVAFGSDRSGADQIWLADADGSNAVQLTSMSNSDSPQWSADGKRIVFASNFEGQPEIYVIPTAGGKPRKLTSSPATDVLPTFSRDGKWIYFNSDRETHTGEFQIWKIPVSGGDAVRVTDSVGYAPVESPDGAYVYNVDTMDRPSALWRLPASGGIPVKVLEGVVMANFAVLEGGIYYIDRPSGQGDVGKSDKPSAETRLRYFDFATHRSTTVARNLGNVGPFFTASPDGRRILYSRMDSSVDDLMLVENFR